MRKRPSVVVVRVRALGCGVSVTVTRTASGVPRLTAARSLAPSFNVSCTVPDLRAVARAVATCRGRATLTFTTLRFAPLRVAAASLPVRREAFLTGFVLATARNAPGLGTVTRSSSLPSGRVIARTSKSSLSATISSSIASLPSPAGGGPLTASGVSVTAKASACSLASPAVRLGAAEMNAIV